MKMRVTAVSTVKQGDPKIAIIISFVNDGRPGKYVCYVVSNKSCKIIIRPTEQACKRLYLSRLSVRVSILHC